MIYWYGFVLIYLLLSYLTGAIPTAYLVTQKLKGVDIRDHGSGNVGATNVFRVVGKKAGIFTLICDLLKGVLPVYGATMLFPVSSDPQQIIPILTAFACILGHSKSIYLKFTGGKSVITTFGTVLVLEPVIALTALGLFLVLFKLTRIVSVGSMVAILTAPLVGWWLKAPTSHVVFLVLMAVYVVYLHRSNIHRLLQREENRV